MTSRRERRAQWFYALMACFCAGALTDGLLRARFDRSTRPYVASDAEVSDRAPEGGRDATPNRAAATESGSRVSGTTGEARIAPAPVPAARAIEELHRHDLRLPIEGANVELMKGGFDERRDAGGRAHEAVDILALRNTPIHAVENGTIAKLFVSKAGGNTVYQFDPSGQFCYYYAHLERYAPALREGLRVSKGDVIGYVGTSGNAPPGTPHLHFSIFQLNGDRRWWQGRPLDPYLVFRPEP